MFAVGHLALGYLTGKATAKILKTNANIPLLLVLSILPDIDLLIPGLPHRGPLHSIILFSILFIPFFAAYRKKATPYFIALVQHSLLGDFVGGGGTQLLWPLTLSYYGIQVEIKSLTSIAVEWVCFLLFLIVMLKTNDMKTFFHVHRSNLLLSIPIFTVLLPTFLSFPIYVPMELVAPHLAYMMLFSASVLIDLRYEVKKIRGYLFNES
jgi:hypothetical protein